MFAHKRSQLGKRDLNSLCWYLTGEMCAPMIDFGTERSPTFGELRGAVAEAVGIPYTRGLLTQFWITNGAPTFRAVARSIHTRKKSMERWLR